MTAPSTSPAPAPTGWSASAPPDAGSFTDPATFDRSTCAVGICRTDTCAGDTSLCPYNDVCTGQADGGSVCKPDPRMQVLCKDCALGAGSAGQECPIPGAQGADFCLIDLHGGNLFCGVDCSQGQGCPSGFDCDDVIILTQNPCGSSSGCAPSTIKCKDTDGGNGCPTEAQCVDGVCAPLCVADEGNGQGFCTCVTDSDCPQDSCEPTTATCQISQQPCVVGAAGNAFCRSFITCVDLQGESGCFIGRNCAPSHGLYCPIQVGQ